MKIIIIEDEAPAARRLVNLIKECRSGVEIIGQFDSVETAAGWLGENPAPDLAFMDIQLADGLSFEIFETVKISFPVIFTTAYDEYALKAFKVNSIDYLLKPIDKAELARALDRFDDLKKQPGNSADISELLKSFNKPQFKARFLVKQGQRLIPVSTEDIAYFFAEDKLVFLVTVQANKFVVDYTIEQLENQLDPQRFFRANRKIITSVMSVKDIHLSFNGKLKIYLRPDFSEEVFVSRERAADFKAWLGN